MHGNIGNDDSDVTQICFLNGISEYSASLETAAGEYDSEEIARHCDALRSLIPFDEWDRLVAWAGCQASDDFEYWIFAAMLGLAMNNDDYYFGPEAVLQAVKCRGSAVGILLPVA